MFCSNCGNKVDDAAKFCPSCGNTIGTAVTPNTPQPNQQPQSTSSSSAVVVEGDFPLVKSKVKINLLPNEQIILQRKGLHWFTEISSIWGTITLTNKRVIWTRISLGKGFLKRGAWGLVRAATNKSEMTFDLETILAIKQVELLSVVQGFQFVTNDDSVYMFSFDGKIRELPTDAELRDNLVTLVQQALEKRN